MSQLIHMRQRIGAVTTIKKITHATRLVAMSTHARLARQEPFMAHYKDELSLLFARLLEQRSDLECAIVHCLPTATQSLIILVGAQKGFCGTLNIALFKYIENHFSTKNPHNTFIAIGKKVHDYLNTQAVKPLISCNNLASSTISGITTLLTDTIIEHAHEYKEIVLVGTYPRTFFNQKPQHTILLPLTPPQQGTNALENYYWIEEKDTLIKRVSTMYLQAVLESLLFSALTAEQAARFHSMDNATRNAQDLLETMQRDYNKLRQTKITKELIELSGSFQK